MKAVRLYIIIIIIINWGNLYIALFVTQQSALQLNYTQKLYWETWVPLPYPSIPNPLKTHSIHIMMSITIRPIHIIYNCLTRVCFDCIKFSIINNDKLQLNGSENFVSLSRKICESVCVRCMAVVSRLPNECFSPLVLQLSFLQHLMMMKNFNRCDSHGHHGSNCQSAANWSNKHTHVDRTHSLTHLQSSAQLQPRCAKHQLRY